MRNLQAGPAVRVEIDGESFTPKHRFLTDDEAAAIAIAFRRRRPHRLRLMSAILGWSDLRGDDAVREFVRARMFIALLRI